MTPARSSRCKRLYAHAMLVSVMLSAVLVARNTPPRFPPAPSSSSSIQAVTHLLSDRKRVLPTLMWIRWDEFIWS